MINNLSAVFILFFFLIVNTIIPLPSFAEQKKITGKEVVKNCNYKYQGDDQKSKLVIILKDKNGDEKKTVSIRMWKSYKGDKGIDSKMVLFTTFPPDAKDTAFMRWAYTPQSGKSDDLWIYLPVLRKVRRISARDIDDKFMGSDLTYSDVSNRALEQDKHTFVKIDTIEDIDYYLVESIPKEMNPFYSKRVSWFKKSDNWDNCVKTRVDYHDRKGELLKRQLTEWQNISNAWVWKKVFVENLQTSHSTTFEISDVKINSDLQDRIFTERHLKRGLK